MITFKQIAQNEWQKGDYRAIAEIHRTTEELFKKYTGVFEEYLEDGLGRAKSAFFITSNGKQFSVIEYLEPNIPLTSIFSLNNPKTMTDDLKEILQALELTYSDLDWVSEKISFD